MYGIICYLLNLKYNKETKEVICMLIQKMILIEELLVINYKITKLYYKWMNNNNNKLLIAKVLLVEYNLNNSY